MDRSEPAEIRHLLSPAQVNASIRPRAEALWAWHACALSLSPDEAARLLRELDGGGKHVRFDAAMARAEPKGESRRLLLGALRARADRDLSVGTYLERAVGDHAELLARLVGLKGSWQRQGLRRMATGVALVSAVIRDGKGPGGRRLLDAEPPDAAGRRSALWKLSVQAKDALAVGAPILAEMPFALRLRSRTVWLEALEWLVIAEKVDYDQARMPVRLPVKARARARLQTLVGKDWAR